MAAKLLICLAQGLLIPLLGAPCPAQFEDFPTANTSVPTDQVIIMLFG